MKRKILITDFIFKFEKAGMYMVYYTSPSSTAKRWKKFITDMTIIDEFKGTETSDHTQKRLSELKAIIKR